MSVCSNDPALDSLLTLVYPAVRRACASFPYPEDAAHDAIVRIAERSHTCRASTDAGKRAWARTVARHLAIDHYRVSAPFQPLEEDTIDSEPAPPHHGVLGLALERATHLATAPQGWQLPADLRARARRTQVAATPTGRSRDVEILLRLRAEGVCAEEVADDLQLSRSVVHRAASRGAAALSIAAAWLSRQPGHLLLRSAFTEIAQRGVPTKPDAAEADHRPSPPPRSPSTTRVVPSPPAAAETA